MFTVGQHGKIVRHDSDFMNSGEIVSSCVSARNF